MITSKVLQLFSEAEHGSVAAIFLAATLVKNFSGKGLVPDELIQTPEFAISIALGAALTVFLATKIGMPISTTHGLVGALFGSGVMAVGSTFNFSRLGGTFLIPLIVSPLLAAVLSLIVYLIFNKLRIASGVTKENCICVGEQLIPVEEFANSDGTVLQRANIKGTIKVADESECVDVYQGHFL